MSKYKVAITRYKKNENSIRSAIELSDAFQKINSSTKIFIKPNIVFWTKETNFPKFGVITTSRVVEDVVVALKDMGVNDITICEGITTLKPKDFETTKHAFNSLGYDQLKERYGVKCLNVFERDFKKVDAGDGISLKINEDILNTDFIVNLPVLKTHAQAVVSLGIKNLKGMLDINSRKICHSPDPEHDLDFMISKFSEMFPESATILDGIYTIERGPTMDGKPRRSDIIIASADLLSADLVGSKVLGHEPSDVKHLVHAAGYLKRPMDFSDIEVVGEKIDDVKSFHEYLFKYNEEGNLLIQMAKMGIKGISYKQYDSTICTYCSFLNGALLTAIAFAWKGVPWDDVEVLTGKKMEPTPGMNKTVLLGQCMYKLHRDNPEIKEMFPVKGCPPDPMETVEAMHKTGVNVNPDIFKNLDKAPGFFLGRYKNKPEFDESFFAIP